MVVVTGNRDAHRFEARADGAVIGVVEYIPLPDKILATRAEVAEQHEGQASARTRP